MSSRLLAIAMLLIATGEMPAQVITFTGRALDLEGAALPSAQFATLRVTITDDAGNQTAPTITPGADGKTYTFTFDSAVLSGLSRGLRIQWSAAGRVPARIDRLVIPSGALAAVDLTQNINVALPVDETVCCSRTVSCSTGRHHRKLFGCRR